MASKYDAYWTARLQEISVAIGAAARGSAAIVDAEGVGRLGDRQSWYGIAEVCGRQMTRSSMAHATSLGRTVAASGICAAWPERTFRFTISAAGILAVTIADHRERARPAAGHTGETQGDSIPKPAAKTVPRDYPHAGDPAGNRAADTNYFYLLLTELTRRVGGSRLLRDCTGSQEWPGHGVYFFFEDGELRADGSRRVVRIGTHALIPTSRTTLWSRLSQHRGNLKGRNHGGGNHRASVFRRHVGSALIRRGDNWPDALLASWLDRHDPTVWADSEDAIEREVSWYIGAMPFLWLAVPEPDDRGCIERSSIALLSRLADGQDSPSAEWLGLDATRPEIGKSGLWNVQHVRDRYHPAFLDQLGRLVQAMP